MSDEPRTVLEAVQHLAAEGFAGSFSITPDGVCCSVCGEAGLLEQADVVRVYRFEGPSDPDEEAVVYGLCCPVCAAGGTLVSSFGAGADPELADRLVMLDARFKAR